MGNNFLISCVNKNEKNVAQQKLTSLQVLQSLNGKNTRDTESYVKREFVQNRRSFHEGKAVMKPNLKSTLGHNKTFQAVLFGEEDKRDF